MATKVTKTADFSISCLKIDVRLLDLFAHTSHLLQHLDRGVFSQIKQAYNKAVKAEAVKTTYIAISRPNSWSYTETSGLKCFRLQISKLGELGQA